MKRVSIIIPVLNEEKTLDEIFRFLFKNKERISEVLFVDGGSSDQSRELIKNKIKNNGKPAIRLLENPNKYVSFALNIAIPECSGDIIVRLDGHTVYADDYIEKTLESFKNVDAQIVGGPMRIRWNTIKQKAIGLATTSSFGVGNSNFHFPEHDGYTDSVYLGAWQKDIFNTTGLFDEKLRRNQDDEFHYRAKSLGFKIYQNPEIKSWYYPRASYRELFKQYFQYGLFKPLVLKKVNSEIKFRHVVPCIFVTYLLLLPALLMYANIFIIPLMIYVILSIVFGIKTGRRHFIPVMISFFVIHFSYGLGFVVSILKKK